MLQAFFNIFRIPDLRNRVLFTLGILIVYRIGFWVPLAGVDQSALTEEMHDRRWQFVAENCGRVQRGEAPLNVIFHGTGGS